MSAGTVYVYQVQIWICWCFLSLWFSIEAIERHRVALFLSSKPYLFLSSALIEPSSAPIFLCSSVHQSTHPSFSHFLSFFHIIHSSIYLPIHTSQDRESNISVPWGYSQRPNKEWEVIDVQKLDGLSASGLADPPTTICSEHTHINTRPNRTIISFFYHLDNALKAVCSLLLTHLMAPVLGKMIRIPGCLLNIHKTDTWQDMCLWTFINTRSPFLIGQQWWSLIKAE